MVVIINVSIGNSLDDTTKNEVLVCDSLDTNALQNLGEMAEMYVKLVECESIISVRLIRAINISTEETFYENVNSKCYSK